MTPALLLAALLNAAGPADPDLAAADAAWAAGRPEQVLPRLERARARPLSPADRLRLYELEALTHLAFDSEALAITSFRHALGVDPRYRPSPRSSPKVLDAFARARAEGALVPPIPPPVQQPAQAARGPVEEEPRSGLLQSPWFWTGVGVVVAGGAAAFVVTRPTVPEGNLGRFELR